MARIRLGRHCFVRTQKGAPHDGMNMYHYVSWDPVNGTDPSGLERGMTLSSGSCSRQCIDSITGSFDAIGGSDHIIVTGIRRRRDPFIDDNVGYLSQNWI